MKTQKTSWKPFAALKSASTKLPLDTQVSFDVALAMYRFWLKVCQLNAGRKLDLVYLDKAHKEIMRLCRQLSVK